MPAVPDRAGLMVHLGAEELGAAGDEGVGPALAQEPGVVRGQHAVQHFPAHLGGQQPVVVRRRPRGVREVRDPDVRALLGQHPRHQRQVVVLHHRLDRHGGGLLGGGALGQRGRERGVVTAERLPLAAERRAEAGLVRRVVQHVVHEPESGVGHRVVGPLERSGRDVQHAHCRAGAAVGAVGHLDQAVRRLAGGGPVGVAQRRAHPQHGRLAQHRGQPGDQATGAAAGRHGSVVVHGERDWPPVRGDENPAAFLVGCHAREASLTGHRAPPRHRLQY